MSTLQVVTVTVSDAQAKALRKLSLRGEKSASELADNLFAQVVRGRFKAIANNAREDAAEKFDAAVREGFDAPCSREEFITKVLDEYRDILAELD